MQDLSKLEHIFVLSMENRSFDQVLGSLALENRVAQPAIDGVDTQRFNLDKNGQKFPVAKMSADWARVFEGDPPHSANSVDGQIKDGDGISMSGFVKTYSEKFTGAKNKPLFERRGDVMKYLDRSDLPVTYFLADHFALCQAWFCPISTGTIPNRLYSVAGQSAGIRDNPDPKKYVLGIPIQTIFHQFDDWLCYTGSLPVLTMIRGVRAKLLGGKMRRLGTLADDLSKANAGKLKLPKVIWIEPSYYWSEEPVLDTLFKEPNDDHPPSDTVRGQLLLAHLYNALTAAPKVWAKSAFIIFYDEHGGFYDHVVPPPIFPEESIHNDKFTQRGPRVPALVVSPFTIPGSVFGDTANGIFYDHCSILKFLSDFLHLPKLTTRTDSGRIQSVAAMLSDQAQQGTPKLPVNLEAQLKAKISATGGVSGRAVRAKKPQTDRMSLLSKALRENVEKQHREELKKFLST